MRKHVGPLAFMAALGALLSLTACDGTSAETAATGPETASARRVNLEIKAEATGAIEPIRIVEVKSKASGEVLRLHAETGMDVTRGTLLASIDPRDVQNAFDQARADMDVAQARLSSSLTQHERTKQMRAANIITEQELESAGLDLANQRASHFRAETNLELARQRLNDVRISAPTDGTIIAKTVEEGTIIQSASGSVSGGTTLFTMADLTEMQVKALIDETDIGRVQAGQPVNVSVEAFPERRFVGTVQKIEPQARVEQNVTMFPVIVILDNRERLLKPGMTARVEVEIMQKPGVLGIPNDAVVNLQDAVAAAISLGMTEEAATQALEAAREASRAAAPPAAPAAADSGAPAGGDGSPESAPAARRGGGAEAPAPGGRQPGAQQQGRGDAAALREAFQRGEITPEMRQRMAALGGRGRRGVQSGPDQTRPGVVFVMGATGPELRMVTFGPSDWDNTEVVRGLDEGEQVVIVSAVRLQQAQQEFQDRMRERMGGGVVPGGPPMGGGRGR